VAAFSPATKTLWKTLVLRSEGLERIKYAIRNQVAGLKPPQAALVKATLVSGFQVFEDILARSE
jgi:hypothetical protein